MNQQGTETGGLPQVQQIRGATVMPCVTHPASRKHIGGLFDTNGAIVVESLLYSEDGQKEFPAPFSSAETHIADESIYCGRLTPHFGHFLLESLARIWFAKEHPHKKLVWTLGSGLNNWQREILLLLGLHNDSIFVEQPTSFDSLWLPSPGFVMKCLFEEHHRNVLANVPISETVAGKKLYVSRTRLSNVGGGENESKLESYLEGNGWQIFHPQNQSIHEQLAELSSSEIVLGIEGSAFHSLILSPTVKTKIYSLVRDDNQNYVTISSAKNLSYVRLDVPREIVSGEKAEAVYRFDIDWLVQMLEDTNQLESGLAGYEAFVMNQADDQQQRSLQSLDDQRQALSRVCPEEWQDFYQSCLIEATDPELAIQFAQKAIAVESDSSAMQQRLGNMMRRAGRFEEAEAAFRAAIALSPESWMNYFLLSHVMSDLGKSADAIEFARKAVEGRENAMFCSYLGKLLLDEGDTDAAETFLARSIDLNARFSMAHFYLSQVELSRQNDKAALTWINKAIECEEKPLFFRCLASILRKQGDVEGADEAESRIRRI